MESLNSVCTLGAGVEASRRVDGGSRCPVSARSPGKRHGKVVERRGSNPWPESSKPGPLLLGTTLPNSRMIIPGDLHLIQARRTGCHNTVKEQKVGNVALSDYTAQNGFGSGKEWKGSHAQCPVWPLPPLLSLTWSHVPLGRKLTSLFFWHPLCRMGLPAGGERGRRGDTSY